jgi:hypothetical protein
MQADSPSALLCGLMPTTAFNVCKCILMVADALWHPGIYRLTWVDVADQPK